MKFKWENIEETEQELSFNVSIPNPKQWENIKDHIRLPARSAVYSLWNAGKITYIGEASNLHNRFPHEKEWESISYLPVDGFGRVILEKILIATYHPKDNAELTRHDHKMKLKSIRRET